MAISCCWTTNVWCPTDQECSDVPSRRPNAVARQGARIHRALRLRLDSQALQNNWRWLQRAAGVAGWRSGEGDGYGLGAREATRLLAQTGCRDFFVSTWGEAEELGPLPEGAQLCVLHGVGPDDVETALESGARPVLNTPEQVARWKESAPARPCDVMVDTGMNRLGLRTEEVHLIEGLEAAHAAQPPRLCRRRPCDECRAARPLRRRCGLPVPAKR